MTILIRSLFGTLMVLLMGSYFALGALALTWAADQAKYRKTLFVVVLFFWLWGVMIVVALGTK